MFVFLARATSASTSFASVSQAESPSPEDAAETLRTDEEKLTFKAVLKQELRARPDRYFLFSQSSFCTYFTCIHSHTYVLRRPLFKKLTLFTVSRLMSRSVLVLSEPFVFLLLLSSSFSSSSTIIFIECYICKCKQRLSLL